MKKLEVKNVKVERLPGVAKLLKENVSCKAMLDTLDTHTGQICRHL